MQTAILFWGAIALWVIAYQLEQIRKKKQT